MRLFLGPSAILASVGAIALGLGAPLASQAQGSGMNCYPNAGGRSNCGLMVGVLMNRIDTDPLERRRAEARHLDEVRGVDQAIKAGHCEEAIALARKSGDKRLTASATRICLAGQGGQR